MNKEQAANIFNETDTDVYTSLQDAFIAGATWQEQQNANIPTQKKIHKASVESGNYKSFRKGAEWAIEQIHPHPHSTYMEFAEWYRVAPIATICESTDTPDPFQYWIANIKSKQNG